MKIRLSALKKLIREAVEDAAITIEKNPYSGDPREGAIDRAARRWVEMNPGATQIDAENAAESITMKSGFDSLPNVENDLYDAIMDRLRRVSPEESLRELDDESVSPEEALRFLDDEIIERFDSATPSIQNLDSAINDLKALYPEEWIAAQKSDIVEDIMMKGNVKDPEEALKTALFGNFE
jgi:hypothetical protein